MKTRPAGRPALAIALLAVSLLVPVACSGRTEPSADSLVLLITADGDGHLDGLPLAIGGGRPLGGVVRLERAVNEERGYRPDAVLVSAGGDVGDFADASVADTQQAVKDLGYQVLTPGRSELDVCGPFSDDPPGFVSANVSSPNIARYFTADATHSTVGVTSVTAKRFSRPCDQIDIGDPLESLRQLFNSTPDVDQWVVLAHMGTDGVELAADLGRIDAPVIAVVTSGARVEAGVLPWEPPTDRPIVVLDAGREWRELVALRLVFDESGLLSYEGTRRIRLNDD